MAPAHKEIQNKARGCLLAGAAGDALGYPVEFDALEDIRTVFGMAGITSYRLGPKDRAQISDDTQMTLFTAAGLLHAEECGAGITDLSTYVNGVRESYWDWLRTQQTAFLGDDYVIEKLRNRTPVSWLADVDDLYSLRAPGNCCLNTLAAFKEYDTQRRANDRKGCGGIMRVAPVGIHFPAPREEAAGLTDQQLIRLSADIAAITHGHPLGYIPAGIVAGIVRKAIYDGAGSPLETIIYDVMAATRREFADSSAAQYEQDEHEAMDYVDELVDSALRLAHNDQCDADNIRQLGEGWVAEETLAISVYCAVRHKDDLSAALVSAVNHDGDSDSTGAVTGNILGALLGADALEEKWINDLELADVIEKVADGLC